MTDIAEPVPIEILNTRRIDAARERVFDAFANPSVLATWWGPAGFTNTIHVFELQPGGTWRVVMRAPDGSEYDNSSRFLDVVRPEKIVYEHLQPMHRFTMSMLHRELGPTSTELTWKMDLERNAAHERLQDFLFQANEQNLDRLVAVLRAGVAEK